MLNVLRKSFPEEYSIKSIFEEEILVEVEELKDIPENLRKNVFEVINDEGYTYIFFLDLCEINLENSNNLEKLVSDLNDYLLMKKGNEKMELVTYFKDYSQLIEVEKMHSWKINKLKKEIPSKSWTAPLRNQIFSPLLNSFSIFKSREEKIRLEYDDMYNFLDFRKLENTTGLIVNVSINNLLEIYNQTGQELFKYNVRSGITTSKSSGLKDSLQNDIESFYWYTASKYLCKILITESSEVHNIQNDLLLKLEMANLFNANELSELSKIIQKPSDEQNTKQKERETLKREIHKICANESPDGRTQNPALFWFKHNGITIYTTDSIARNNQSIVFSNKNFSVINGAQTITNCFSIIQSINISFNKKIEEILEKYLLRLAELAKENNLTIEHFEEINSKLEKEKNNIDAIHDSIMKGLTESIKIKCIIVEGKAENLDSVTIGLNTQIPVTMEDVHTHGTVIANINSKLMEHSTGCKIVRQGERNDNKNLKLLDFIKMYYTSSDQPGKARSYTKKNMKNDLNEIFELFSGNDSEKYIDNFVMTVEVSELVDKWWRKRSRPYDIGNEGNDYLAIQSNSKYYMIAFTTSKIESIDDVDDELLQTLYEEMTKKILSYKKKDNADHILINSNTFKNDTMYNEITKKSTDIEMDSIEISEEKLFEEFKKEESESTSEAKNINSILIKNALKSMGHVNMSENVRTITVKKDGQNLQVTESFSFKSATFNEFVDKNIFDNMEITNQDEDAAYDLSKFEFKDSILYKEMEKKFLLVIIVKENDQVVDIKAISDFSFFSKLNLQEGGKNAFEKTKSAFMEGEFSELPSIKDGYGVHVRPKGQNSTDTFTFSDNLKYTKRTFWVNESSLTEYVKNLLQTTN